MLPYVLQDSEYLPSMLDVPRRPLDSQSEYMHSKSAACTARQLSCRGGVRPGHCSSNL